VSGRSTQPTIRERVETVYRLRLGGATFIDIREYADAEKDFEGKPKQPWNVSDSQLRRYITAAEKLFKERLDARADFWLSLLLLRRERLYAHTMEVGDYRTALAVSKDQADLLGLYERDNPTNPLEALLASLSPETAREIRAALAAALPGGGPPGGPDGGAAPDAAGLD
jgi:hypothetical protein